MNDDGLDPLLHALRSPARAGELRGESEAVESMMSALSTTTGQEAPTMFRRSPHRARVAALVAAGVIGFAGVAAAGPGGFARIAPSDAVAQLDGETDEAEDGVEADGDVDDADTVAADDAEDDTTTPVDGAESDDDGDVTDDPAAAATEDLDVDDESEDLADDEGDRGPKVCEPYANHGERVSEAAALVPGGPHKGEIIRAIATDRTCDVDVDALWPPADETEVDTEADGTDEAAEAIEDERGNRPDHAGPPAERPDQAGSSDESRPNGNGNGNGNGRPENPGRPDRD